MWRLEERVAARGHLAEAAAEREHEIGVAQPSGDRLVHRDPENADVARRAVVDEVLAAKRARHRKLVRLAEGLDVAARVGRPAALSHDDERALGAGEQLAQALEILCLGRARLGLERAQRPRRRTPRRGRPPEGRAPPARAGPRRRSRTPRTCARECGRRCRSPMPPSRCLRRRRRSRAPATPPAHGTRAAPGRPAGSSGTSLASPCGLRPRPASRRAHG